MPAVEFLITGPSRPRAQLLLAHGSGAPMDSPLLEALTAALATLRVRVFRFEFPYMAGRRTGGPVRPPDRMPELEASFRTAIRATRVRPDRLAIGGKSLGGRVATRIADDVGCRAVVVYGYPFHPPGKPERLRTAHLAGLQTPCLILQGQRDRFGSPAVDYGLARSVRVIPVPAADHGLVPTRRSGRTVRDSVDLVATETVRFLVPGGPGGPGADGRETRPRRGIH